MNGVPVAFSTNAGTLTATSVITDTSGNATTTLTTTATATVTANAGGGTTGSLSPGTVVVNVNPKTTVTVTSQNTSGSIVVSAPATFTIAIASSGGTTGTTPTITNMTVDFGDGSVKTIDAATSSVVHQYGGAGVFTVTVTVTDSTGAQSKGAAQIAIAPLQASVTHSIGATGTNSASFTVTTSTGAVIDHYFWDFGDGQTQSTTNTTVTHNFPFNGPKNVSVTVVPVVGSPITVPDSLIVGFLY